MIDIKKNAPVSSQGHGKYPFIHEGDLIRET